MRNTLRLSIALTGAALFATPVQAQYFGRNKVQYETFDFRVLRSPHFESHFYPAESLAAADASRMAERWYARFSSLLGHTFKTRPLVFYADHPDFQQTNVIGGLIGEGTGGVTESARNRVILPFTGIYASNDHVLGHEIVHVFQYDIADSLMRQKGARSGGINALPLWLIEGMAEYLSLGRDDPHTAMWLRDALLRNDLPTIRQLTSDSRFFPYRYGEALWAYIGGKWGDETVTRLYRASLREGFEPAIKSVLHISHDSLSKEWQVAIREAYTAPMQGMTRPRDLGTRLLPAERRETGMMEVSPALSPDGRSVAFLSARNLVSVDLFIADVATGRIVKQLTTPNRDRHFGSLSFISAAGSWSPDGRQLAYVTIANGDNQIAIFDVERRKVVEHFEIPGVGAVNDAAWGPSGEIAFSGMRGGISDLYLLDPRTKHVRQLTDDRHADLQPAWSPDGRTLAFTTDRGPETDFVRLTSGPMRLATIDVATARIELLPSFDGAKQINPQYAPDGNSLFFISDRDGFSNIYRLSLGDRATRQVTRLATGVSGITELSPALTVASRSGRMVFSVFDNAGEVLYRLEPTETEGNPLVAAAGSGTAGVLPPAEARTSSRVMAYLADATTGLVPSDSLKVERLDRGLGLEYLGSPGVGVSVGGFGGTGVGGAVQAYFSDMLNNHVVGATLYSGGSLRDVGGETFYLNQRSRLHWGAGAAHVPYLVGAAAGIRDTTLGRTRALVYEEQLARVYVDQASLISQYPLSATRRIEAEVSANRQRFEIQSIRNYVVGNQVVARDQSFDDALPALNYAQASLAYVGDYSAFGLTSPIAGGRYRFEASPMLGSLSMTTVLTDYRRYIFLRPVTLAFRGLHYGRYGADAENNTWLQSMFLGYSSLVRGYTYESFSSSECSPVAGNTSACPEFDRLLGSRIAVASAELRIPLLGPRQLALIPFNFLPVEVAPFVDAGEAWTRDQHPTLNFSTTATGRIPVVSTGVSTRFNLFGAMVLEVYYAHPFQRPQKGGVWGFQLQPGW